MSLIRLTVCGLFAGLTLTMAALAAPSPAWAASDMLAPATPSLTAPAVPSPSSSSAADPAAPDTLPPAPAAQAAPGALNLNTPDTPGAAGTKDIDPKDIPDILMEEVQTVEANCRMNSFYSSFHDCRCIAVKFLDARLNSDPDTAKERVFEKVAEQCPDEPSIAGFIYQGCVNFMRSVRKDDYDAFCTCSANDVARAYVSKPVMNLRYIEVLRRNAYVNCGVGSPQAAPPSRR